MTTNRPRPVIHGRDHAAGGADPFPPGQWGYATPIAPAATPADYNAALTVNAAFINGAFNSPLPDGTYSPLRWRLTQKGKVQIEGSIDGVAAGSACVILPAAYWPDTDVVRPIASADGTRLMTVSISASTGAVVPAADVIVSSLPASGVTPGTYGDASHTTTVIVDSTGRITSAINTVITIAEGAVTGLVTDLAAKIAKSIFTAKGSLIASSAAATPVEVVAATNGWVLTLDSAQAAGMKWAASGGGVSGPGSSTAHDLAGFADATGAVLEDSGVKTDTDGTLAANSDARLATQKATKTYVDAAVLTGGAVSSVFGRAGAVVAVVDDYAGNVLYLYNNCV